MRLNNEYSVMPIPNEQTHGWLLNKHYAKRLPQIMYSYGLYSKNTLIGLVTYGIPVSVSLVNGIAGDKWKDIVLELNRLVINDDANKNSGSYLIGNSIKQLPKPTIIVSYADTNQNHVGYVYQATNFIYTGLSDAHGEWREIGVNKHSKNVCKEYPLEYRQSHPEKFIKIDRPRKHRYVYILADKTTKKQILQDLNYPIMPYPKGDTKRYDASYIGNNQMRLEI